MGTRASHNRELPGGHSIAAGYCAVKKQMAKILQLA